MRAVPGRSDSQPPAEGVFGRAGAAVSPADLHGQRLGPWQHLHGRSFQHLEVPDVTPVRIRGCFPSDRCWAPGSSGRVGVVRGRVRSALPLDLVACPITEAQPGEGRGQMPRDLPGAPRVGRGRGARGVCTGRSPLGRWLPDSVWRA